MTQTLLVVVLFVGAMALLPWAVRRLQQRQSSGALAAQTSVSSDRKSKGFKGLTQ